MSGTEEDLLADDVVVARMMRFRLPDLHRDAVSPLDCDRARRHPTDEHPPGPTGLARRCSSNNDKLVSLGMHRLAYVDPQRVVAGR